MLRASRFDRHGGPDPLEVGVARPAEESRDSGDAGAGERKPEPEPGDPTGDHPGGRSANGTPQPVERTGDPVADEDHQDHRPVPAASTAATSAQADPATPATQVAQAAKAARQSLTRTRAITGHAARRGMVHTGDAAQRSLTRTRRVARTRLAQSRDLAQAGLVQARRAQTTLARKLDRSADARTKDGSGKPGRPPDPALPAERTVRENFPVALRILPARHRKSLGAVYRYARLVDDIGDEAPAEARGRLLDQVDRDLDAIYAGRVPELPALQAMREVVRAHAVPEEPLRKLVQANRQDQEVLRYETWDQLVEYCTLSADPVGLLVLHVFDAATPERIELSNRICTALQIIEHCQDVAEDFARGRVYLPAEDLRVFGCTDADLAATATPTRLRGAVTRSADRAAALLDEGEPLVRGLDGWAGVCVAGYVAGGRATLAALRAGAYDVHARRLRPSRVRTLGEALLVLGGK